MNQEIKVTRSVKQITCVSIVLGRKAVIDMLNGKQIVGVAVPPNARVVFHVPGDGGDLVEVTWTEETDG